MRNAVKKSKKAKVIYVLNGWNRFKASRDFLEWFEGMCKGADVVRLPQSEQFVQAGADSKSVVEYARRGRAVDATLALVNAVRTAAEFAPEGS